MQTKIAQQTDSIKELEDKIAVATAEFEKVCFSILHLLFIAGNDVYR